MLTIDINNMRTYYSKFAPELKTTRYTEEMWSLYEEGKLKPNTTLTGIFVGSEILADVDAVVEEITAVEKEEERKNNER